MRANDRRNSHCAPIPDGDDRTGPRPLRALPPAPGSRRGDAGRDLLRSNTVASLRDPASSWQAGRRPDGFTVPGRVPRCEAAAASARSKSCLKGCYLGEEVGRRVRARRHRRRRGAGLCAPTPTAIPIAPLHCRSSAIRLHRNSQHDEFRGPNCREPDDHHAPPQVNVGLCHRRVVAPHRECLFRLSSH